MSDLHSIAEAVAALPDDALSAELARADKLQRLSRLERDTIPFYASNLQGAQNEAAAMRCELFTSEVAL